MPGQSDEEYIAGSTATRAVEAINSAIEEGKGGSEILSLLSGEGIRVYTSGELAEEGVAEEPLEELPEELPEEPPMEEEPLMEEEGLEGASMPYETPPEPTPSDEGGMRDLRISAVKYALDKDKEKKEGAQGA